MSSPENKWNESRIAAWLCRHTFSRKHLIVPNCSWPGSECDLLVITTDLRIIDVEIKRSRADLRADAAKDKWFHAWDWKTDGYRTATNADKRRPREWPHRVWKHYYVMPGDIWTPDLLPAQSASGVLLLGKTAIHCERKAKPCRDAERITAEDAIDIARLAGLRMWDAYDRVDRVLADAARSRQIASGIPA